MKNYEKAGIAIGAAALSIAAYQAYKTKQGVDATEATDPAKNPVSAAIGQSSLMIGNTWDWFRKSFNRTTGYTKGKADDVINTIKATPSSILYQFKKGTDFGRQATESGTKYIWSGAAAAAKVGKEQYRILTNKPFTLMGGVPQTMYNAARTLPKAGSAITNVISGVGSGLEKTSSSITRKIGQYWRK